MVCGLNSYLYAWLGGWLFGWLLGLLTTWSDDGFEGLIVGYFACWLLSDWSTRWPVCLWIGWLCDLLIR